LGSTTLASIAVPNTGGGQSWTTVSKQATLTSGTHTFKIVCTGSTSNLNWFSFEKTETFTSRLAAAQPEEGITSSLNVFPNPASGTLRIQGNNGLAIDEVAIISTSGVVKVIYPRKVNVEVSLLGIAKGLYILRIRQDNRVLSRKVVLE
jgi:hypothetical protein